METGWNWRLHLANPLISGKAEWLVLLLSAKPKERLLKRISNLRARVLSHSVMSDSLRPHGLQHARLLCPWDFPGKNTAVAVTSYSRDPSHPPTLVGSKGLSMNHGHKAVFVKERPAPASFWTTGGASHEAQGWRRL